MGMEVIPPKFVKIRKPTLKERILAFIASSIFIAILVGAFCLAQFLTEGI
mgnify:CR=1 FL=1